ncbi:MAG: cytidylate kinase-like family protein [Deltaproteobacteria bacterium]|nr:MAG: cytidylate kinase-like family protein [Deltaproteobacteria bacterium]
MSIITISRGSYSKGREIAEKAAERLGYGCIGRRVLLEASEEFNIPEVKLRRAIHDAPSVLERFAYGKEKYIAYIQSALLKNLKQDNVVYHGLAGHFFLKGVSHVLKVRIIADMEDRVKHEMEREGISREDALEMLKKDDEQRVKWSKYLYGIDTRDPSLYDLVIHIHKITVEDAADIICDTVKLDHFKTTPESQKKMESLALAAEVKAALVDLKPDIDVSADPDGTVTVQTRAPESREKSLIREMQEIAGRIPGVRDFKVEVRLTDIVE